MFFTPTAHSTDGSLQESITSLTAKGYKHYYDSNAQFRVLQGGFGSKTTNYLSIDGRSGTELYRQSTHNIL